MSKWYKKLQDLKTLEVFLINYLDIKCVKVLVFSCLLDIKRLQTKVND